TSCGTQLHTPATGSSVQDVTGLLVNAGNLVVDPSSSIGMELWGSGGWFIERFAVTETTSFRPGVLSPSTTLAVSRSQSKLTPRITGEVAWAPITPAKQRNASTSCVRSQKAVCGPLPIDAGSNAGGEPKKPWSQS